MEHVNIGTVRKMFEEYSNWGRWGDDDQLGTLNFAGPDQVKAAGQLIRTGEVLSLSVPFDADGPQHAASGRFNPIHLMTVTGRDHMSGRGTPEERDRRRKYLQNADDVLILPLQSGTQWDGLAHVFFEQRMYNGFSADHVTSSGARRNAVDAAVEKIVGRGVLLDLPRALDVPYLEPGRPIGAAELDAAGLDVQPGDFVLVRTGALVRVAERGEWGDYAAGPAAGLGLDAVGWLHEHRVAGVATDTWSVEVIPAETPDVETPVHILLIVAMGLWLGEIFDLERLAAHCAEQQRYEFFFAAQPLRVTGAIGSPINPLAIF